MGDDRPPVYYDTSLSPDGSPVLVIRASAVGHPCLWELVAAGQGVPAAPIPASLRRAFDEGNELEPVVIGMLEDMNVVFFSHQDEGELWLSDDVVVRYHPDGIANLGSGFVMSHKEVFKVGKIIYPVETCVVEVKAFSDILWQKAKAHGMVSTIAEYEWQLSAMMHDAKLPGLWVAYNKGGPPDEDGNRIDCPDKGKLYYEWVPTPPISLEEIQLKASLIKLGVEGEDILTSDRPCGSPDHYPCQYLSVRPEPEESSSVEIHTVSDDELEEYNRLVREYIFHKGQADEAILQRDAAKQRLIELTPDTAKTILTDKWRVPVVRSETSYVDTGSMSEQDREAWDMLKSKYTKQKPKAPYLTKIKRIDE